MAVPSHCRSEARASDTEAAKYVGWKSVSTAQYYMEGGSLSFFFVQYIHINVCDLKNSS